MKCPFCSAKLAIWKSAYHTTYGCKGNGCMVDDMPRFQTSYNNYPTYLISKTFMLDKYYVQVNYQHRKTVVSVLEVCFLLDSIEINRVMDVDFNNLDDLLNRIKTLMIFS